ncbi:CsiV family protein [Marinospirillum perlucidum]|uniref:CsiV family protein n=1 Tax=Marinospirillum perlucidum TaxID=1982602 RepID=UPI000DF14D75|nr:CsiV family protein [Marinospirillum perlucidum]
MRLISSFLLALAISTPVLAVDQGDNQPHRNERDYIIELLVFTQNPGPNATEQPGEPHFFQAFEEPAYTLGPTPFWSRLAQGPLRPYQPRELSLTNEAEAIERSDTHRLLFHDAWQMPVVARERSLPLLIEAGDYYDGRPELMGKLTLSVARYLHLETELYLHEFVSQESTSASSLLNQFLIENRSSLGNLNQLPSQTVEITPDETHHASELRTGDYKIEESAQMRQRRRMRSGELHYIDSPYLGLLIKIERAPDPEEASED